MSRNALLKASRLVHLYLGVFITPALIFFAFTGALQTFGLHETNRDHPDYKPAKWIAVLAQIHKKQTPIVPVRRQPPPAAAAQPVLPDAPSTDHPHRRHDDTTQPQAQPQPAPQPQPQNQSQNQPQPSAQNQPRHTPIPMRIFFLIVSLGLFTSTLTGLYMSYKYVRNRLAVTLTLIAGIVVPLLCLL